MVMVMAMNMDMARTPSPKYPAGAYQRNGALGAVSVTLTALMLAVAVGMSAFVGVARTRAPDLVPMMWHDPIAPMVQWGQILQVEPSRVVDPPTREVALAALDVQPLNAPALRLLAMWEEGQNHPERANHFAYLSEKVTRRDLLTQLFLLERAVAKGNIPAVLTHYDKALRVSPDSKQLLFPVLMSAMDDPSIRDSLAVYAEDPAPWIGGFLFTTLDTKGGAVSTAKLLLNPRVRASNPLLTKLSDNLLTHLANQQAFALAEQIIKKRSKNHYQTMSDLSFSAETTSQTYGAFSWQVTDNTDADIAFQRKTGGGQNLYISIAPYASPDRSLVERILHLTPGQYRFVERQTAGASNSVPYWQIECATSPGQWTSLWRSSVEQSPAVRIPPTCAWQRISLRSPSVSPPDGVEMTIDSITLQPDPPAAVKQPAA